VGKQFLAHAGSQSKRVGANNAPTRAANTSHGQQEKKAGTINVPTFLERQRIRNSSPRRTAGWYAVRTSTKNRALAVGVLVCAKYRNGADILHGHASQSSANPCLGRCLLAMLTELLLHLLSAELTFRHRFAIGIEHDYVSILTHGQNHLGLSGKRDLTATFAAGLTGKER